MTHHVDKLVEDNESYFQYVGVGHEGRAQTHPGGVVGSIGIVCVPPRANPSLNASVLAGRPTGTAAAFATHGSPVSASLGHHPGSIG